MSPAPGRGTARLERGHTVMLGADTVHRGGRGASWPTATVRLPMAMTTPAVLGAERVEVPLTGPLDLTRTCARFVQGHGDPCNRIVDGEEVAGHPNPRRTRHPPASGRVRSSRGTGLGSGKRLGSEGCPGHGGAARPAESFDPPAGPVRRLNRQAVGLRIPATGRLLDILVPTVIAQKVTGQEAFSAWRRLVRLLSGPAPGRTGAVLPPAPEDLAILPAYRYHPLGMERRRPRRSAGWLPHDWLEEALRLPLAEMYAESPRSRGRMVDRRRGAVVGRRRCPDAVGDHLPNQWRGTGASRGRRRQDDRPPRAIPRAPSAGDRRRDGG